MQIRKDSTNRITINQRQYPVASTSAPWTIDSDTTTIKIFYNNKPVSTSLWSDISFVDEGGTGLAYVKDNLINTLAEVKIYLLTT